MDKKQSKTPHSDQFDKIKAIVSPELHYFISEHHDTWSLMDMVRKTEDEEIYNKALNHIATEINNHFKFEEELILPMLSKYIPVAGVGPIDKLIDEHRSIESKYSEVKELVGQGNFDDDVIAQIKLLAYLVKKHIEKEDNFFFPMISLILNQAEKAEIESKLGGN